MDKDRIPLISRVFRLLEAIPETEISFSDIQKLFPGVPSSTVSRLLKALMAEEIIERENSGGYRQAMRLKSLASRLSGTIPRHERLRPVLEELAIKTGESSAYFEKVEGGAVLLAKHEIAEAFHYMDESHTNKNIKTHGFNKLLHGITKKKVFTNQKDDKALVMRVVGAVEINEKNVGVIGVSFFCESLSPERQKFLEEAVSNACRQAGEKLV